MVEIDEKVYVKLRTLGIVGSEGVRDNNVGASDYSQHVIQPWAIWQDWNLNPWDADIIKRVLRTKEGESRVADYNKIIHICKERLRQIECETTNAGTTIDFEGDEHTGA